MNGEPTPPRTCPPSSPLSSPVDVELSDSSFLNEVRGVEAGAESERSPRFGQEADPLASEGNRESEDVKGSQPASQTQAVEEDELAGDLMAMERGENSEPIRSRNIDSAEAQAPPSGTARTRRMPDRQKKIIFKQPPKKTPRKTVWTAERLITDPKSPLAKADLRSIVANPMAWEILDVQNRKEILALFPHQHMVLDAGTDHARPDIAAMMNDDTFRGDCASYTEHIKQGRHDHDWLASAYKAHHRRRMGDFDDFLVQKVSDDWGVELPENFQPRRQAISQQEIDQSEGHDDIGNYISNEHGGVKIKHGLRDVPVE